MSLIKLINLARRTYSSALFVNGREASSNFVVLRPVLDFETRILDKAELDQNFKLRRLDVNLRKIEQYWNYFKHLDGNKIKLESAVNEIKIQIEHFGKEKEKNKDIIDKLILQIRLIRDDLKNLKNSLYDIEERAALNALSLPNFLHHRTPYSEESEIFSFREKPVGTCKDHMEIAYDQNLIEFTNPMFCYLKGESALFEQAILNHFNEILIDSSFTLFSNYDFSRSVVVEGCGSSLKHVYNLQDIHNEGEHKVNRLNLTGSSSVYAFMSYFTRNVINSSYFPLKCFSSGQKYTPKQTVHPSLFNFVKESCTEIFMATYDDDHHADELLDSIILLISKFYKPLNCHFRLVYSPAPELALHESLRISIQMFSPHRQRYLEVGYCSAHESYLSKRLLFNYSENKIKKFPRVISGTVLRVQPLLACLLENEEVNGEKFISNVIEKYVN